MYDSVWEIYPRTNQKALTDKQWHSVIWNSWPSVSGKERPVTVAGEVSEQRDGQMCELQNFLHALTPVSNY